MGYDYICQQPVYKIIDAASLSVHAPALHVQSINHQQLNSPWYKPLVQSKMLLQSALKQINWNPRFFIRQVWIIESTSLFFFLSPFCYLYCSLEKEPLPLLFNDNDIPISGALQLSLSDWFFQLTRFKHSY